MKLLEWVVGHRLWLYIGIFGVLQLYLSVKWRLSDRKEEKLKLEISGVKKESSLEVEGEEVSMED